MYNPILPFSDEFPQNKIIFHYRNDLSMRLIVWKSECSKEIHS